MYKAEMKNSYKSMLDDQMNQHKMSKQIESVEKQRIAQIAATRHEMQRA